MPKAEKRSTLVYCIVQQTRHKKTGAAGQRSYVGMTHNVAHRLRQHNGEITGGAKSTRRAAGSAEWKILFLVTGFPRRRNAAQVEKRLHTKVHIPKRYKACPFGEHSGSNRAWKLFWALQMKRVTKHAPLTSTLPLTVHWRRSRHLEVATTKCPVAWPLLVKHVQLDVKQLPNQVLDGKTMQA